MEILDDCERYYPVDPKEIAVIEAFLAGKITEKFKVPNSIKNPALHDLIARWTVTYQLYYKSIEGEYEDLEKKSRQSILSIWLDEAFKKIVIKPYRKKTKNNQPWKRRTKWNRPW